MKEAVDGSWRGGAVALLLMLYSFRIRRRGVLDRSLRDPIRRLAYQPPSALSGEDRFQRPHG